MPPKSKRSDAFESVPAATEAARRLKAGGEPDLAEAVQRLIDFTVENTQRETGYVEREASMYPNRPLQVHRDFRTHVNARRGTTTIPKIVVPYLERFVAGQWVPERPKRTSWKSPDEKVNINLRVSADLWDDVDRIAKDPEAVAARGYKLTATQVAIAALREEFGDPAEDTASQ